jgi:large subunit ribosomal protein L23
MALFTKKTNTEDVASKAKVVKAVKAVKPVPKVAKESIKKVVKEKIVTIPATVVLGLSAQVLKNPRITEKASFKAESGVYTFNVYPQATKFEISHAIFELYKVRPTKVNITAIKAKKVFSRNKRGSKGGGKKAYVYLAKGDKIEFV